MKVNVKLTSLSEKSRDEPSQFKVMCSIGLTVPVRNSMWCPVKDRKSKPGPLEKWSMSMLTTSNVSQLKRMSADSFPVLYLDFSSSAIDFDSQIVGDDCWSSFTDTTWMENKSLNQMMSPDSSSRNFIPFKPRFSDRLESSDSMTWKYFQNYFHADCEDFLFVTSHDPKKEWSAVLLQLIVFT